MTRPAFRAALAHLAAAVLLTRAAAADPLTFTAARTRLLTTSPGLAAARAEEARRAEGELAARGLAWPTVEVGARFTRIDEPIVIDLAPIRQVILALHPAVPAALVPPFTLDVQDESFLRGDVRLTWPLFTAGRIPAAQRAAAAESAEAAAERRSTEGRLSTDLARRYFGVRLAARVLALREEELAGLRDHARQARRLEEEGQIARAERLRADVAVAEATRDLENARQDLELARSALERLLALPGAADPATSLPRPIELAPLASFVAQAREAHPALARLAAQRELARQARAAARGELLPELYAFGVRELYEPDLTLLDPAWAVGLGARWTLFDGGRRRHKIAAAERLGERVEALTTQAGDDIALLTERAYRNAEKARTQHAALAAVRELAAEALRAREHAFAEGFATSLDVVDARNTLTRVEVGRLAAANDWAVALAELVEACGTSDELPARLAALPAEEP